MLISVVVLYRRKDTQEGSRRMVCVLAKASLEIKN